jgi:hypothetical protein
MKTGGIITLMYNKETCKVCGSYLTSVLLCEVCEEQISCASLASYGIPNELH